MLLVLLVAQGVLALQLRPEIHEVVSTLYNEADYSSSLENEQAQLSASLNALKAQISTLKTQLNEANGDTAKQTQLLQ